MLATACLKNQEKRPVRLMFQDEARFGRMSNPRACWAPAPARPMVKKALIREYKYQYAAVSPSDGALDHMTSDKMNTDNMSRFLDQVGKAHESDIVIMVLDGASSHKAGELKIPENIGLLFLPPYSPELNPAERIWNRLRKDYFVNKVFDSLDAATNQAVKGLSNMAANSNAMISLTNWPWINRVC